MAAMAARVSPARWLGHRRGVAAASTWLSSCVSQDPQAFSCSSITPSASSSSSPSSSGGKRGGNSGGSRGSGGFWTDGHRALHGTWALGAASVALALSKGEPQSQCYYETRGDGSVDRLSKWARHVWGSVNVGDPAFHSRLPHQALLKHLPKLRQKAKSTESTGKSEENAYILVPLCGKTGDLPYLCEHGFHVIGVEGVQRPIREFNSEMRTTPLSGFKGFKKHAEHWSRQSSGTWKQEVAFEPASSFQGPRPGMVFKTGNQGLGYYSDVPRVHRGHFSLDGRKPKVNIIQGDMFDVHPEFVEAAFDIPGGKFSSIYDRGAIVAIPTAARREYVATLSRLLQPGGRILMVTVEYDVGGGKGGQGLASQGPRHFPLPVAEVKRLFPSRGWSVEVLDSFSAPYLEDEKQGNSAVEKVILITKKEGSAMTTVATASVAIGLVAVAAYALSKALQ